MSTTYAQKQSPAQKKDAPTAASILDTSSQNESLQRKANMISQLNVTRNIIQMRNRYTPNDGRYPHLHEYTGGICYSQGTHRHTYLQRGNVLYNNNINTVRTFLTNQAGPRFAAILLRFNALF